MGATNSFESEVLRHILLNEAITNLGDAGGLLPSVVAGSVYIALLSQDPGEAGDLTNEALYVGYVRKDVARGGVEWSEADGQIRNVNAQAFVECTGGSETITHFGLCKTLAGDDMFFHAAFPSPFDVSIEVQPQFDINTFVVNLD
jgi:hypothetical protein